jgi:DNA-binding XRE family transcriptional regulator
MGNAAGSALAPPPGAFVRWTVAVGVAAHRESLGMTQKEVARGAGLTRLRVEAIEQGELPSLAATFELATALQVSTTELLHQVRQYANQPLPRLVRGGPDSAASQGHRCQWAPAPD